MAPKRFFDDSGQDSDQLEPKRMGATRPTFAAVLREAVMVKSLQSFCSALEPMLRTVVNEEVEKGFTRAAQTISRPPPLQIQAQEPPSDLELCFPKKLLLPVFTAGKVKAEDNHPLQVIIVDTRCNQRIPIPLPFPIKIEIVVIDGDFGHGDSENWTSQNFDNRIVHQRKGKSRLITGDVVVTMREGFASIGDLSFTDNSSWVRSRTFRLGARVDRDSISHGLRVREAVTEQFVVKDHRGELYKKHHPPSLNDDVWRLEKIGKDGVFHKKLGRDGVNTVQDFLKLWVVEPTRLRAILGVGMSDKMFESTIKHANSCVLSEKRYVLRGPCYTIFLNPICQVVGVFLNGMPCPTSDLGAVQKVKIVYPFIIRFHSLFTRVELRPLHLHASTGAHFYEPKISMFSRLSK